jgi:hypothetical protein
MSSDTSQFLGCEGDRRDSWVRRTLVSIIPVPLTRQCDHTNHGCKDLQSLHHAWSLATLTKKVIHTRFGSLRVSVKCRWEVSPAWQRTVQRVSVPTSTSCRIFSSKKWHKISLLTQTQNEHSSGYQTMMCIYLIVCGTSRPTCWTSAQNEGSKPCKITRLMLRKSHPFGNHE